MTTDARARTAYSEGLALIEKGIQRLRIGVEIERTLNDRSEPETAGTAASGSCTSPRLGGGTTHERSANRDAPGDGKTIAPRRTRTIGTGSGTPACANGN